MPPQMVAYSLFCRGKLKQQLRPSPSRPFLLRSSTPTLNPRKLSRSHGVRSLFHISSLNQIADFCPFAEDQTRINSFSKLNTRLQEIEENLKNAKVIPTPPPPLNSLQILVLIYLWNRMLSTITGRERLPRGSLHGTRASRRG
jgi:hypothetical protein